MQSEAVSQTTGDNDDATSAKAPIPVEDADQTSPVTTEDQGTQSAIDPAPPALNPIVEALLTTLTSQEQTTLKASKAEAEALKRFYAAAGREPIWLEDDKVTDNAKQVIDEIKNADDWGLKASAFDLPTATLAPATNNALALFELKLSLAALRYANHAAGGRLKPRAVSRLFDQKPETPQPVAFLWKIAATADPDKLLRDQHPTHPQFHKLRQALLAERQKERQEKVDAATATVEDTSAAKQSKTKKKAAKKKFRQQAFIRQIIANMERWRWMPRQLGDFYVWDDVPEQTTSVIKNGKVVLKEKIIVGKPKTPTPIFSDEMELIIFHPSWGVPPGMKKNELWPKLRNTGGGWFSNKPLASSVLKAHRLNVTRGGVPVNPDSINWSNVNIANYHFTQPPGPKNVLGVVKFRFPNKHNVYMHDTPERHLFGGSNRSFSHGCMRVQNPVRLAEVLLEHDKGWSKAQVRNHKRKGRRIKLTKPIPVHIAYFTVHVDDDGQTQVRRDLYGLDRRVASAIEGRRVRVGVPLASPKKQTAKKRRVAKKKKAKRRTAKRSEPFNPFASTD
ncbi:MAG: L,D-transpeptidase family protein [Filomicrobium sp.]